MATVNSVSRGPSVSGAGSHHGESKRDLPKKTQAPRLVSELPYTTLSKLSALLDTSRDGAQVMWRKLIEQMPQLKYNVTTVEKFALNANQPSGSPAYALLTDMSNRGISYDELITALKKLNFYTALTEIGHREAVSIIRQPEAVPASVGQSVTLECEASGVPKPSYLWFKGREPLPEHTTCQLHIDKVIMEDSGQYCCRASNEVNIVFSSWAEIKVSQPKVLRPGTQVLPGTQEITASPQIIQAPSGEYHMSVNDELRLVVVAVAPPNQELSYQWFRDGQAMPYARGNELYIPCLQLGDNGVYSCRVSTKLGGSKLIDNCIVQVMMPQENGGVLNQQIEVPPMGMAQTHPQMQHMAHHTAMQPQPPVNYHPSGHMGGAGGIPPQQHPGGMPPQAQGMMHVHVPPGAGGSVDSPSTHMTELITTPGGSQGSVYSGVISPSANPFGHEGVRPHDLPIYSHGGGGGGEYHHGATSKMYYNDDVPSGEQVDFRQPPFVGDIRQPLFTTIGGDDLLGGQGELRPDLMEPCYDKVALLIGNKNYRQSTLKLNTPENDAQDLGGVLRSAGFKVVSLVNLNKVEMEKALQYFASLIGKNVYALFFFAGHGFELNNMNYMMAVDADVEKRPDQCICAQQVLHTMQSRGAKLSIVLLDMCRVSASTPLSHGDIQVLPQPRGTNGYFVIGFSCSPAERAFEAGTSPEGSLSDNKYKDNSIFVAALREHLQRGTLNRRVDNLLTDSAAGVRQKGQQLQQYDQWQKPEVRSNLGEDLTLNDPIKNSREVDSDRQQRTALWQRAHTVPDSVVVSCHGDERNGVKPGEVAFRLHFEAEHSNVLIVTAELLTGCLSPVEVTNVNRMVLITDYQPDGPKLFVEASNDKQYKFSERSKYNYGHQQGCRNNDLLHFKIPDIQKIKSQQVVLRIEVEYIQLLRVPGSGEPRREKTCLIEHIMNPPLYAQVLSQQLKNGLAQQFDCTQFVHGQTSVATGQTSMQPTPN